MSLSIVCSKEMMNTMYTNEFYKIMTAAKNQGMNPEILENTWGMLEDGGWDHRTIVNIMWKKIELNQY